MVLHSTFITLWVCVGGVGVSLVTGCVQLFLTPQTVAHQDLLSMRFSRQEYWLPCPPSGDLPNPGIEPCISCIAGRFFATELRGKPCITMYILSIYLCTYLFVPLPALECQFHQDKISVCFVHGHIPATWKSAWHIIGAQ